MSWEHMLNHLIFAASRQLTHGRRRLEPCVTLTIVIFEVKVRGVEEKPENPMLHPQRDTFSSEHCHLNNVLRGYRIHPPNLPLLL